MPLTVKRIERLSKPGKYPDGRGLYLKIGPTGAKSWVLRYERNGRERAMGLGPVRDVSLDTARELSRLARMALRDKLDPIETRKSRRDAAAVAVARTTTFEEVARSYHTAHAARWKNSKHAAQFLSSLETYVFPIIGSLPVADIDTPLILKVLEAKHPDHPKATFWQAVPETARRTLARIEQCLDYAAVRGHRKPGDNPARWKGHIAKTLPARSKVATVRHHPALPYDDLPAFMVTLAEREGTAARALEFLILSACRTGEVIGAQWPEIDLKNKIWTVPAERMKANRPHRVPLTDAMVALLKGLPREENNPFVFVGMRKGTSLSNMAMLTLLKRMERADLTVHGFRSSFRDWCAERTAFPREVAEQALAHTIGDAVERAYRRGDLFAKRVKLMEAWTKFALTPPAKAAVVVPMVKAKSKVPA